MGMGGDERAAAQRSMNTNTNTNTDTNTKMKDEDEGKDRDQDPVGGGILRSTGKGKVMGGKAKTKTSKKRANTRGGKGERAGNDISSSIRIQAQRTNK